jgi:hypothetical protein
MQEQNIINPEEKRDDDDLVIESPEITAGDSSRVEKVRSLLSEKSPDVGTVPLVTTELRPLVPLSQDPVEIERISKFYETPPATDLSQQVQRDLGPYDRNDDEEVQEFRKNMLNSQAFRSVIDGEEQDVFFDEVAYGVNPETGKPNPGPPLSLADKYGILQLYNGTKYYLFNDDGTIQLDDNNQPILDTLLSEKRRQANIEMQKTVSPIGKALNFFQETLDSKKGPNSLRELDERLAQIGMNETGRAFYIDAIKNGALLNEKKFQGYYGFGEFLLDLPDLVRVGFTKGITLGLDALDYLGDDGKRGPGFNLQNFLEDVSNSISYDIPSMEQLVAKNNGIDIRVAQQLLQPQGLRERLQKYGPEFAGFYGAIQINAGRVGTKHFRRMEADLIKDHGGRTFYEAVRNSGEDVYTLFRRYTEAQRQSMNPLFKVPVLGKLVHEKRMELGYALAQKTPEGRKQLGLLKPQMDDLNKKAGDVNKELVIARRAGDLNATTRAKNKLLALEKKKKLLADNAITPKVVRDAGKDLVIQTGAVAGIVETYSQVFNNDPAMTPFIEIGASFAVAGLGLFRDVADISAFEYRRYQTNRKNTVDAFKAIDLDKYADATPLERLAMVKADKNLDKEVKKVIKDISLSPPAIQRMIFDAAEKTGEIRKDLVELASMSNVPINVDAIVQGFYDVASLGALRSLALSYDSNIAVSSFNEALPIILQKEETLKVQELLGVQISEAVLELTRALGKVPGEDFQEIRDLTTLLGSFLQKQQATIDVVREESKALGSLSKAELELMHYGTGNPFDGGAGALDDLNNAISAQDRAHNMGLSATTQNMLGEVQPDDVILRELAADLNAKRQERQEITEKVIATITPESAAIGEASMQAARQALHHHNYVHTTGNGKYDSFIAVAQGSFADIRDPFNDIVSNPDLFNEVIPNPEGIGARLRGFKEGKLTGISKVKFNHLLLGAAERSIENLERQLGQEKADSLFKALTEAEGINLDETELTALDRYKLYDNYAQAENIDPLPLLINAGEWKLIRHEISNLVGKNPTQNFYRQLKAKWDEVGNPESPLAFKEGWFGGEARISGPEVFDAFRDATTYWEQNILSRYSADSAKDFNKTLNNSKVKRLTAENVTDAQIQKEFLKFDVKDQPIFLLNNTFAPAISLIKDRAKGVGQPLIGNELTMALEQPLARLIGLPDRDGIFRIVVQDDMVSEAGDVGVYGRSFQKALRLHMQGLILNTPEYRAILTNDAKQVLKKYTGDRFQIGRQVIDNLISGLETIPVYRRTVDGDIVPFRSIPNQPTPNVLVHKSEIEDGVTSLNLTGILEDEALKISKFEKEYEKYKIKTGLAVSKELRSLQDEFRRDLETSKKLIGGDPRDTTSDIKRVQQDVYNAVISGSFNINEQTGLSELRRKIKKALREPVPSTDTGIPSIQGVTSEKELEDLIDQYIYNQTIGHILSQSRTPTGALVTVKDSKTGRNFQISEVGIDNVALAQLLGLGQQGGAIANNLKAVLNFDGKERYEMLTKVVGIISRIRGETQDVGVTGRIPSLSVDSLLSRGYNISRGVVNVQYSALEVMIRQSRRRGGLALKALLRNPELGIRILDFLDSNLYQLPERSRADFIRIMTVELLRQEAEDEYRRTVFPEYREQATAPRAFTDTGDLILSDTVDSLNPLSENFSGELVAPRFTDDAQAFKLPKEGNIQQTDESGQVVDTRPNTADQLRSLGFNVP